VVGGGWVHSSSTYLLNKDLIARSKAKQKQRPLSLAEAEAQNSLLQNACRLLDRRFCGSDAIK